MNEEKAALRRLLRFRRCGFTDDAGAAMLAIHAVVIARVALNAVDGARSIAAYLSNGREVDAMPLVERACAAGIRTALPHIDRPGGAMRFLNWRPGDPLHKGPYDILQPFARADECVPEAIIAPLVAFDRAGHRLGQGGGFYDRAFAAFPDARRVGLAWSVQEIAQVPVASWDQPLHAVITEREWILF